MKGSDLHSGRRPRYGRYAFTLVELLVTIGIITILLTVIVGVTSMILDKARAERTKVNMQVILQAIEEYRLVKDEYPPDETDFSGKPGGWTDRDWEAYCLGEKLYTDLALVPQAKAHIANLEKGAIKEIELSNVFIDGFKKCMEYREDEGVNGTPVIISAGPDGDFDTPEDNIRSDNQ